MDTHQYTTIVDGCTYLPEAFRVRARTLSAKLTDAQRGDLAGKLQRANDDVRQGEEAAERQIVGAQLKLVEVEHGWKRAKRDEKEERAKSRDITAAEENLEQPESSSSPIA